MDVKVQLRLFKVESVSPSVGHMRLKVWLRFTWYDQRLVWNATNWAGVSTLYFNAKSISVPEDTE